LKAALGRIAAVVPNLRNRTDAAAVRATREMIGPDDERASRCTAPRLLLRRPSNGAERCPCDGSHALRL